MLGHLLSIAMVIGSAMGLLGSSSALAQNWPDRSVTMVVPFGAGSGVDVLGRVLAQPLSEILGQQVVVENVAGAGGMTGTALVARAAPDGYQFVLGNVGTHALNPSLYPKPLYNVVSDFAPSVLIADTPQVLIARADLPANTLQEFAAYLRANQAKMQYGSPGVGSAAHLGCVLLNAAVGVNVTHIPYRSGGAAMQDLIAGRLDYQCPLLAIAVSQIESKKVKALAILTRNRSAVLPGLATAHEQGLSEFDVSAWNAFFFPKGTPQAIVQKLHDATVAALDSPAMQARLKQIGAEPASPGRRSPDYLQRFVEIEVKKWAVVIKAAGVTAE